MYDDIGLCDGPAFGKTTIIQLKFLKILFYKHKRVQTNWLRSLPGKPEPGPCREIEKEEQSIVTGNVIHAVAAGIVSNGNIFSINNLFYNRLAAGFHTP